MPTPGVVHDPLLPLVLGNESSGLFCVQTYNPALKLWQLQVTDTTGPSAVISTLTMGSNGELKVNNVDIGNLPSIIAQVNAAAASAAAAAASAVNAQGFMTTASEQAVAAAASATAANTYATDSLNAANLSRDYASADEATVLPNGLKSSKVYSEIAAATALESRDQDVAETAITADRLLTVDDMFMLTPVTQAGLTTLTVPPALHVSDAGVERWMRFRNLGAGGSIKVVPQAAAPGVVECVYKLGGRDMYRQPTIPTPTTTRTVRINAPNVTAGLLICCVTYLPNTLTSFSAVASAVAQTATLPTPRVLKTPNNAGALNPTNSVTVIDLIGFTAQWIDITYACGPDAQSQALTYFVIDGHGGDPLIFHQPTGSVAATAFVDVVAAALVAKTRVLSVATMRGPVASVQFSSFSAGHTLVASGSTQGALETAVSNTNLSKNHVFGYGQQVMNSAGDFTLRANFSTALYPPGMVLMCVPPLVTPGGATVVLHKEGGRDTCAVADGELELHFWPNGLDVSVKTPDA